MPPRISPKLAHALSASREQRPTSQFRSLTIEEVPHPRAKLQETLRRYIEVDPKTGCHIWTANRNSAGYGQMAVGKGRKAKPHRVAYELAHGPIPDGLSLDHLCRTPACCNPAHLEPVTISENLSRAVAARRTALPTHCEAGHELTAAVRMRGGRCRLCSERRQHARHLERTRQLIAARRLPIKAPFKYPEEFVRRAVLLANEMGVSSAARHLGLDKSLVCRWRQKLGLVETAQ